MTRIDAERRFNVETMVGATLKQGGPLMVERVEVR
jgi:hypothetical protein